MTRPGLLDLVASRSYFITKTSAEQQAILGRVRDLADHHPDLAGREQFEMPYRTWCWRYQRR